MFHFEPPGALPMGTSVEAFANEMTSHVLASTEQTCFELNALLSEERRPPAGTACHEPLRRPALLRLPRPARPPKGQ